MLVTPGSQGGTAQLLGPAGQILQQTSLGSAASFTARNLAAGTYTVRITPWWAVTATAEVTVVPAVTGVLSTDGTTSNVSTTIA